VSQPQAIIQNVIARLEQRSSLSFSDKNALLACPISVRTYPKHAYLVREGEFVKAAQIIIDGLAYRHKVTDEGKRQILSLHIPGDFVDLEGSLLNVADHNVQALETSTVASIPRDAVLAVIENHAKIAHALWIDTLVDAAIYREWIVNVGQRDAKRAMCHLLCEFGRRLEIAGLADGDAFRLPMTQEQLGDCLGITPVHVNRILKELSAEGLIVRDERHVRVPDLGKLAKVGGFNELYLHLGIA
jgi:CRP-like cAMP-binding protein